MFDIKLLGPGQVYYHGKAISGFPAQQHCLLFYYLLLNRQRPHTREQVATVFWGESSASLARKYLRNTLWRLNQAFRSVGASLDDFISVQEDYIVFTNSGVYRLDLDEFEAAFRCSQEHTSLELSPEQVSMLEKAADLYRGDLLEGVYDDWCLYERERLRLGFLKILIKLMDYHGHQGSYERGLEYGQRILLLDPTRERVHRQMMMLHWLAGDREAALLQYRSCYETLQVELDLKPVQETQHLYDTILRSTSLPDGRNRENPDALNDNSILTPSQSIAEVLQKLHFLKMIVEQTNTELHLLEGMIHKGLSSK
jgi:DNA-binding SARP family transcriptional activator